MECFKIKNLSFTYPEMRGKTLNNISLTVNEGEFITICGKSGCGKTTLLRLLKSSNAPFGKNEGEILFFNKPLSQYSLKEQASKIGFVMQNPENQTVTDKVWHELAFGLENMGLKTDEIRRRVSETASYFGIQSWFHNKTAQLSGGQKQLLSLAAVMLMHPSVLILDEPTSCLDPIAAREFINTLEKINRETGVTVILAEHRTEEVFGVSDRVIVMDEGKIISDENPRKTGKILKQICNDMYEALPTPAKIYAALSDGEESPINIREGRDWLNTFSAGKTVRIPAFENDDTEKKDMAIEVRDVFFRYEKNLPDVVKGLNLKVRKGEFLAILGGNAAGKTTALSLIAGIKKPYRGKIDVKDKSIGYLPQNPQTVFVKKNVYLDLLYQLSTTVLSKKEKEEKIAHIAKVCRIENVMLSHPYDLSGGEAQRAALAKILLTEPQVLLLDEPTKGMDVCFKKEFADILRSLGKKGVTVIAVSHDMEFCAKYADRCALFFDGGITSVAHPVEFFSENSFYTTSASRMARHLIPNAVVWEDVVNAFGEKKTSEENECKGAQADVSKKEKAEEKKFLKEEKSFEEEKKAVPLKKKKTLFSKSFFISLALVFLAIPLTIYCGMYFFDDRKYYFISLIIILETLFSFAISFEKNKVPHRKTVVIAVLCALAVASRTAFFMLPQIKPIAAIVVLSGVCFSAESGFAVGAVSAFLSNFFFGQGPWTPWQMFAMGLLGFAGGVLFEKGLLKKTKVNIAVYGFLSVLLFYGGILNPASVIMYADTVTLPMIISSYAMGIPYDLIFAATTAVLLWIASEPMIDKLERIKKKYGLM